VSKLVSVGGARISASLIKEEKKIREGCSLDKGLARGHCCISITPNALCGPGRHFCSLSEWDGGVWLMLCIRMLQGTMRQAP
jgi:hypothetical protein